MDETEKIKKKIIANSPKKFRKEVSNTLEYVSNLEKDTRLHLLNTGLIIAEAGLDTTTIIASLRCNTQLPQDSSVGVKEIVEEVKHIENITENEDTKTEIITKYILNNTKDLRAVITALARVLDTVKHIETIPEEKRKTYLKQSMGIYSDIAEYLDFGNIKREIDEKGFEILQPIEYEAISKKYKENDINGVLLNKYLTFLKEKTKDIDTRVSGRIKSKYSVYNKLKKHEKEWLSPNINTVSDIIAFRFIAKNIDDCFNILEKIMDNGEIDTQLFDDYISAPKKNGYKAIHTCVTFPNISPLKVEIQILTEEMHYNNTYGKASHIAYKASKSRYANPTDKYKWVEQVHNSIEKNRNNREKDIDIPINTNLFQEDIFVFTPKGQIIPLSKGDTALDFAYRIHSQIGNSAVAVKINGKAAKLGEILRTGDVVEVKTQKDKKGQNINMLQHANSQSTKSKILRSILKVSKN